MLRRQIGRMIVTGFTGTAPEDEGVRQILRWIAAGEIGGVILYAHNIETPEQLKKLTSALRAAAPADQPPIITVDQEGGLVQRLSPKKGFHGFPAAKKVGATMSVAEAEELYGSMAREVAECGINHTCGPCVDVAGGNPSGNVIERYGRSYSEDPQEVYAFAAAFVRQHERVGVGTSPKHYPRHGGLQGDTHKGFVDATGAAGREEGLYPYKMLHAAGLLNAVMTAHVFDQAVDSDYPATLSSEHLGVLREKIGFDGPIFSDDMMMGAIQQHYFLDEAVKRFVLAGGDIMVFSMHSAAWKHIENPRFQDVTPSKVIDLLVQAIAAGGEEAERLRQRIEESNGRIKQWKAGFIKQGG